VPKDITGLPTVPEGISVPRKAMETTLPITIT